MPLDEAHTLICSLRKQSHSLENHKLESSVTLKTTPRDSWTPGVFDTYSSWASVVFDTCSSWTLVVFNTCSSLTPGVFDTCSSWTPGYLTLVLVGPLGI